MADSVLVDPAMRRRVSYRALQCSPSSAHGDVTFSLETPPLEEEPRGSLDACFRCQSPLRASSDVFMYRGDAPFCSEECRQEQIELDEARQRETRYRRRRERHQHQRADSAQQATASAHQRVYARAADAVVAS